MILFVKVLLSSRLKRRLRLVIPTCFLKPAQPSDVLTFPTFGPICRTRMQVRMQERLSRSQPYPGIPSDLERTTAKLLGLERTFTKLYLIH